MLSFSNRLKHHFLTYPKSNNHLFSIFVFAVFFLPYLISYHIGPIPSFFNEVFAIGLSSYLLFFLRSSTTDRYRFPFAGVGPLSLALILIVQAWITLPAYWDQRLTAVLILCWFSLMVFCFANLRNTGEKLLPSAAMGLFASALATTILILLQGFPNFLPFHPPAILVSPGANFGNMAQVNHAAALLALGCASGVLLLQQRRLSKAAAWVSLAGLLWGGMMTGSKGFVVYIITLVAIEVFFSMRKRGNKPPPKGLFLIIGIGVIIFYLIGYFLNLRGFIMLLHPALAFTERGPAMLHAWRLFVDHPFLGFGWSQFSYGVYLNSSLPDLPKMWALGLTLPNHCHNIIFQLLANAGFLGTAAALFTLVPLRWNLLIKDPNPIWQWLLSVFVVLALFSQWEYPLWYAYFLLPLALFVGFSSHTVEIAFRRHTRFFLLVIPLIITGFLVKHSWDYVKLTLSLEKINTPAFGEQTVATLTDLQRWSLFSSYVEWFCPGIMTPESSSTPEEQIATCERMLKTMPVAEAAYRIPLLYQQMNETSRASISLRQAYSAFPFDLKDYIDAFKQPQGTASDPIYQEAASLVSNQEIANEMWLKLIREVFEYKPILE